MHTRQGRSWFLFVVPVLVSCSLLMGSQPQSSRAVEDIPSLAERVKAIRGSDASWHVPATTLRNRSRAAERQGLQGEPLKVYDVSGRHLGNVYQIRSDEGYVGLLLVVNDSGRKKGLSSGFSDVEWPLDRVSREVTLNDLDNSLFEPKFYLQLDEDRLLLRVNLGKKELELSGIKLNVSEIRRGEVRRPDRSLQR